MNSDWPQNLTLRSCCWQVCPVNLTYFFVFGSVLLQGILILHWQRSFFFFVWILERETLIQQACFQDSYPPYWMKFCGFLCRCDFHFLLALLLHLRNAEHRILRPSLSQCQHSGKTCLQRKLNVQYKTQPISVFGSML